MSNDAEFIRATLGSERSKRARDERRVRERLQREPARVVLAAKSDDVLLKRGRTSRG